MPRRKDNPEERRILNAVDVLVQFVNLTGADVAAFRSTHPNFVPTTYWSTKRSHPDVEEVLDTWRIEQALLQKAWRRGFPLNDALTLISNATNHARNALAFEAVERGESLPEQPKPLGFPFQQATMFMAMHPDRAKICERCKSYFVADHHLRRFCSLAKPDQLTCFAAHRKEYKRKDGQTHHWYRDSKKGRNV